MNDNLAYQEERREEIIGGKVVMMSPRPSFNHNQVSYNISRLFGNYLYGKNAPPLPMVWTSIWMRTTSLSPISWWSAIRIKSRAMECTALLTWWWKFSPPAQRGTIGPTKKRPMPNVASGNTGLSVLKKSLWRSTGLTGQNLSSMIFTPFIPTGSLPRCPRKSGLLW